MAFAPLQLRGALSVDSTDVSDQVMAFNLRGTADDIEIPATFGVVKGYAGGDTEWEIEIVYLQDIDATALTQVFFAALGTELTYSGTLKAGSVSATNPSISGSMIVSAVGLGGAVNEIGQDTVTFKCTGTPVQATS